MPLSTLDRLLWAAGLAGHGVLLAVLFSRGRARFFPAFTALIAASILRTALLYVTHRSASERTYFVTFVGVSFVDVLLQFAVVYEVASHVFRPLGHWAPDARRGMRALSWGSLLVAGGLAWLAAPVTETWTTSAVLKADFFCSALMSELCVGMIVLSLTVGLPWRPHVARIAHGLGAYSVIDVAIGAGHALYATEYGGQVQEALTYSRKLVYLACLGYWIVTLWQDAPQPRELPAAMRAHLRALETQLADNLVTLRGWRKP